MRTLLVAFALLAFLSGCVVSGPRKPEGPNWMHLGDAEVPDHNGHARFHVEGEVLSKLQIIARTKGVKLKLLKVTYMDRSVHQVRLLGRKRIRGGGKRSYRLPRPHKPVLAVHMRFKTIWENVRGRVRVFGKTVSE